MKRIAKRAVILVVCLLLCSLSAVGLADAGNFSSDSDWGGGSDWGSGSDWGDSDWGSDWGSDYGSGSYSGGGSGGEFGDVLTVIIVVIVIVSVFGGIRKQQKYRRPAAPVNIPQPQSPGVSLDVLKRRDPNFSEQRILDMVGNLYVQMQDAWESKQWEPMRMWMSDSLYNQMARQLDELIRARQTNHVDRIAVMSAAITRYAQEGEMDALTVRLTARITDYTVNDDTGAIVNGSNTAEKYITYDWKLIRRAGRITPAGESVGTSSVSCPHCGAPMDVRHSGKCGYCGAVLTLSDHDWALSSITGISQRTAY